MSFGAVIYENTVLGNKVLGINPRRHARCKQEIEEKQNHERLFLASVQMETRFLKIHSLPLFVQTITRSFSLTENSPERLKHK